MCPNQPESYNGFEDTDGCPDSDPSHSGGDFDTTTDDPNFVGVDPALAHGMIIPNLINEEKYVFEVSPINENGAARATNTVVVIPHALAGETGVSTL